MSYLLWFAIAIGILSLACFYLGWRLITPFELPQPWNAITWVVLWALFLFMPISMFLSRIESLNIPSAFDWVGYTIMGVISFLFTFFVLRDLSWVVIVVFKKMYVIAQTALNGQAAAGGYDPERRRLLVRGMGLGILAASASLTGYGIFQARRKPPILNFDIPIPNLPDALNGFRIVQITDVHTGLTIHRDWVEGVVEEVNKLSADLVAFTGDMVDGTISQLKHDVEPLIGLKSRLGTYFVTGNHEYYSGALPWVREARKMGFDVLINENRILNVGDAKILLAGVTDYTAGQFVPEHKTDPQKALNYNGSFDASILMAHQPRSLYEAAKYGFDLMLSGHTHGGQFFPWNFLATLGQPYIKGLHKARTASGEGWVYVSKGTGYWGPPVRLGARSEISVFTLKKT